MNLLSSGRLRIVLNVDADSVLYLSAATDPDPAFTVVLLRIRILLFTAVLLRIRIRLLPLHSK
jgi:hypothetical protein